MKIDLHTHTNFSACADKNNSWQNLLIKAESEQIVILSITDHNTCAFYDVDKKINVSDIFSGKIIPGIELDVAEEGMVFELLAYNFDIKIISDWAIKRYGTLQSRQEKLKDKLVEKITKNNLKANETDIKLGEKEYAHACIYNHMVQFKENLNFLKKYNINSFSDLYRMSTEDASFPLYIDASEIFPGLQEVVSIIHKAKGIVVLAHPFNYKHNVDVEKLLQIALSNKVDGIEAFHPSCNDSQSQYLLDFAEKNNLVITGGSDYHGTEKHNKIGLSKEISILISKRQNFIIQ